MPESTDISYKGLLKGVECINCKGRGLCGRPVCPVLRRLEEISALADIGDKMEGVTPPEVFVGRYGYPLVRAGPMMPVSDGYEGPSLDMDVGEVIALRSSMIRSEARIGVREAGSPGRILEAAQQMAMAAAPVGAEVSFLKPPKGNLQFDGVVAPSGPSAPLKGIEITTNPLIPRKVDQIVEDRSGAALAAGELYSSGIDVDHISRLLSLGLLGRERKLVPTRWSITASDDMVGKTLKESVIDRPVIEGYRLYSGEGLGNRFEILLMPEGFRFELIEAWMPGSAWAPDGWIGSDSEGPLAKKGYSPLAGGYYAARLAVLEGLADLGRQASVLAVREISGSYWAPLGVWVVREAARKAMAAPARHFGDLGEALGEMGRNLATPPEKWRRCSSLLRDPVQKSLFDFI